MTRYGSFFYNMILGSKVIDHGKLAFRWENDLMTRHTWSAKWCNSTTKARNVGGA